MSDDKALRELLAWSTRPDHISHGMCFVPIDLFRRAGHAVDVNLKKQNRFGYVWDVLTEAGIRHFLAVGFWIVPEPYRSDAIGAVKGHINREAGIIPKHE